jgi:hypothetical protein
MSCGCFTPGTGTAVGLDPTKRVNYQLGLVLGEDEFRQDQFHHRERDHLATRALHGYGTVAGLAVSYDAATDQLEIEPGLAVDPAGRLICVPVQYCGSLGGWVRRHAEQDEESGGAVPTTLFLTLCWTECATDDVPIPADSCLSAENSRAASRLRDSFEIKLVTEPPPPVGEVAPTSEDDSLDVLVAELHGLLDNPSDGQPPDAAIDAALRRWVVERRPEVVGENSCLSPPDDTCILLARIDFAVDESNPSGLTVDDVTVDASARPVLVTTRLLQEALFRVAADLVAPDHTHTLDGLDDVEVSERVADGDALTFDRRAGVWIPRSLAHTHALDELSDVDVAAAGNDDVLAFNLSSRQWVPHSLAHGHNLRDLGDVNTRGAGPGMVLEFNGTNWAPAAASGGISGPAGGDLTGTYPDPRLAAIQGTPVDAPGPAERDVLILRGEQWVAGRPRLLPFATIFLDPDQNPEEEAKAYIVWFNLDAPGNEGAIFQLDESALTVHRETESSPFLEVVGPLTDPSTEFIRRNVFKVFVRDDNTADSGPLRFEFRLANLPVTDIGTVADWATATGTWFVGESNDGEPSVTIFVFAGPTDVRD